jgi:hypothetical protein
MLLFFILNLTLPGVSAQGDRIYYSDARSLSLGGASVVLEGAYNPAAMGMVNDRMLQASGCYVIGNERRGLRVYDSYGNNIGIATKANNTSTTARPGPIALIFPFKMLRLGLSYENVWDFRYYYRYEQRDDFYQLVRIDETDDNGYLWAFAPKMSISYSSFSLGLEYGIVSGKWHQEDRIVIPQAADSIEIQETEFSGNKIKVGIAFVPNLHFRISYLYQRKYVVDDIGFAYPDVHSLGIMYQPPGRIPTKFLAQVDVEMWDPGEVSALVDSQPLFTYRIGVEHTIISRYALRYGFCIFPDYIQRAVWTTNLTLGFGVQAGRFTFDVGYAYGKRDYMNSDFQTFDVGTNYKFDETTHNILLTAGVSF